MATEFRWLNAIELYVVESMIMSWKISVLCYRLGMIRMVGVSSRPGLFCWYALHCVIFSLNFCCIRCIYCACACCLYCNRVYVLQCSQAKNFGVHIYYVMVIGSFEVICRFLNSFSQWPLKVIMDTFFIFVKCYTSIETISCHMQWLTLYYANK